MKFYLSSYKIGPKTDKLKELTLNKKIGYIPNALDYVESEARGESNFKNLKDLVDLGIDVQMLDLKNYFGKKEELKKKIDLLDGVWVRGGNTFVLRQAMKLSGFDDIIKSINRDDFFYGGYSAGICILAPTLKVLQQVDRPDIFPYEELKEVIWDGLGILDYIIFPHYKSDHPESADIDKEIKFCKKNNFSFKTLRDGEVIIIE
ncbi:MAG: Type 1 glutamine amidotransferase-like domain-containing protein [Patescibacteria group bacterium]|jgi:dipeptidase E